MPFIDFAALKSALKIEEVAQQLGLQLKQSQHQFRAPCPRCQAGGDRALVITPAKQLYFCFAEGKGGDVIALTAHIRECEMKDAAAFLAEQYGHSKVQKGTSTVSKERATEPQAPGGLQPLDHLQHSHPAVEAIGIDPEDAKALGIGYAARGLMRGTVAIPVRLEDGTLVGYVGVTECKLPPRWQLPGSNVVPLKKGA